MRRLVVRVIALLVDVFYRRVEVVGLESLPAEGPVLLVANHANGLVDPMLVLAALPRGVVFVAKSTLWRIPGLRSILNRLEVVPVVRRRDVAEEGGVEGAERNEASFERLASVLTRGGAVLIFPEGRSHSDPALSPIRSGAARILQRAGLPVTVVPLGIWFTRKEEFRSDVLLKIGSRIPTPPVPSVEEWTRAIGAALDGVTLNASDWEDHEVVAAVEELYGTRLPREGEGLDRAFRSRRLLLKARAALERVEPGAVSALARKARALTRVLARAGLPAGVLEGTPSAAVVAGATVRTLAFLVLGGPVAGIGSIAFFVPYRLTGVLAGRIPAARERDQLALYKILVGAALFPAALAFWTFLAFLVAGGWAAALAALFLPLAGLFTVRWLERVEWGEKHFRALLLPLLTPRGLERLRRRRDALVTECDRLAAVYAGLGDNPPPMMAQPDAEPAPISTPATGVEVAAWILMAGALLFVFHFHLASALVAGLLVQLVLHKLAGKLGGRRFSHGTARMLSAALVALTATAVVAGFVLIIVGLVRGHLGDLPALFSAMAEALEKLRSRLGSWGLAPLVPQRDAEQLQKAVAEWLREHGAELESAGGRIVRFVGHALIGIVIALLVFLRHGAPSERPFAAALAERGRRLAAAFENVVLAQVEISLINTFLTGVYLFVILPLAGIRLPLSGTLLLVTFLAGLIPVAGNLISNSVIVVLSLGVSPWLGLLSLGFLIVVHKLEYVLNAKIVGGRIGAAAWETLLSIVVFEVAFGLPGVVLAPVIYAYVKRELRDRGLV